MPYIITNRNGDTIVVPDEGVNTDFSIELVGRNTENFGQYIAENFIDLLDNFATLATPPANAVDGQIWYDKTDNVARTLNFVTSAWKPLSPLFRDSAAPINLHGQNTEGTMYYNRDLQKLFIHNGSGYTPVTIPGEMSDNYSGEANIGSPATYGSRIRNIYLVDTDGDHRAVLAMVYTNSSEVSSTRLNGETLVAIFSDHDEFVVADVNHTTEGTSVNYYDQLVEATGIGTTIRPGLNLRADNDTRVEISNVADRAETAFALNTGSYGADGANITASEVYFSGANVIPISNTTYNIGEPSNVFGAVYAHNIRLGDGTTSTIERNGNSVISLGSGGAPIDDTFLANLTITGEIFLPADFEMGNATNYIGNIYVDTLTANLVSIANYTMPTTDPSTGYVMYADANSEMFWAEAASNIADVESGNGIVIAVTSTPDLGPASEVSRRILSVEVGAGTGIIANTSNIEVNLSDFDTDDLPEGLTNQYYTSTRTRGDLSVVDAGGLGDLAYDNGTGVFTYTGPSGSDLGNALVAGDGITITDDTIAVAASFINSSASGIRALFSNVSPVQFNTSTGSISIDQNLINAGFVGGIAGSQFIRSDANDTVTGRTDWTGTSSIRFNPGGGNTITMQAGQFDYAGTFVLAGTSGVVQFTNTGAIIASGDITAFSDIKFKDDLQVIENALDKVEQLTGYTFLRNDMDQDQRYTGVIAQDVEKVLPEAVRDTDDGKSVAYGNMVGLIVEAIKELRHEINELKKSK